YFSFFLKVVRLPEVVDGRDIEEQVERQFRVVTQDLPHFHNMFTSDMNSLVTSKSAVLEDAPAQKLAHAPHQRGQFLLGSALSLCFSFRSISGHIGFAGNRCES